MVKIVNSGREVNLEKKIYGNILELYRSRQIILIANVFTGGREVIPEKNNIPKKLKKIFVSSIN